MQLSQGPFNYNRFDIFEGKGASDPEEMEKKVKEAGRKNKLRGEKLKDEDEKEEEREEKDTVDEGYKALPTGRMQRQASKAYDKENAAVRAGDEKGANVTLGCSRAGRSVARSTCTGASVQIRPP